MKPVDSLPSRQRTAHQGRQERHIVPDDIDVERIQVPRPAPRRRRRVLRGTALFEVFKYCDSHCVSLDRRRLNEMNYPTAKFYVSRVNVASVNYYFGSKTGLAHAVFDSLAERVNTRRIAQMDRIIAEAKEENKSPDVRALLRTFIRPYFEPRKDENGQLLAQLIFHHRSGPTEFTAGIVKRHFDPMARRFIEALQLACPHVPADEMIWRYSFLVGAVVLNAPEVGPEGRAARLSEGRLAKVDSDQVLELLVGFLTPAVTAPGARREQLAENPRFARSAVPG